MNRREFLKGVATVSLAGSLATLLSANVQADAGARLYKGTAEGKILESDDGGRSWQVTANFGKTCPIWGVYSDRGELYAEMGASPQRFFLKSSDGRTWYTSGWQPVS
jgi:hypothetical protein